MSLRVLIGAVMVVGLAGAPAGLRGQVPKASSPKLPPALEQARKYATPGEQHRLLDSIVGSFDTTAKYWLMPGGEPLQAKGSIESKWILGGRVVEFVYKTEMFGDPYEGRAQIGYDNFAKEYVSTWADEFDVHPSAGRGVRPRLQDPDDADDLH